MECTLPLRTVVAAAEPPPGLPYYDVDLVGAAAARYHMPHFWSDFAPAIEAYGVLLATNRSRLRVSCVGEGACDEKAPPGHHLVPAVLLHDRLREEAPGGWVKTVLGMLPPKKKAAGGAVGGPALLYVGDVFPGGFVDLPVAEQVATMQSSHVVVSLHGAEMTNALFLRRGAVIAEVMPAFYEADIFPRQADPYGVVILQVAAKPDGASHTACVTHFNPPGGPHARAAAAVVTTFGRYAANAALPAGRRQALQGMNKGPLSGVPHMRMCLREQVLEVDAVRLARDLLAEAVGLCSASGAARGRVGAAGPRVQEPGTTTGLAACWDGDRQAGSTSGQ
ncbi:hypothetical protein I4F81_007729 [Pyropia yezoensis]|uniref:Uncharacterized protein n=1 Tax=Pyropia yezoensis TaxID=2788 RepID=A0ACC3C506_PYRYE|nr:hypothetical protein I4F81_007729 [Neopyropia yezoensis]